MSGQPPRYINKKNNSVTISQLKEKQQLAAALKTLKHNIPLLTTLCENYLPFVPATNTENTNFTSSENPAYPETLIHNTSFGMKVRSKSEAMIANALFLFHIPQYYERKLTLTDTNKRAYDVYPDFTIPLYDGSFIYWEHKGKMYDQKYRQHDMWKENLYYNNGIYPPKNLIVTMDGPNQEFDLQEIHRLIKGIILPRL